MDNAEWVGEAPSTESEWEGEGPEQSGSQWLGDAPKHNWGTQDARDLRKNKITAPEALSRGASQFVPSLVESANYPGLGAMSLWDKAASALGGKDTTAATDWYAKNFMEPSHKIIEANQLQPGESYSGLGAEVAHKVPAAAGKLAGEIIPSLVPAVAATATIQKSLQFTIPSLTKALGAELTPTVMAGTPMATKTATETYDRLKEAGVPEHRAVLAATADGLATYLQLATPMSAKGNVAVRAVTGAGVGYTGAKAQTNLVNAIVNDYSNAQIHRTTGDDLVAAVLGGTLSAGLGKKGEPKAAKPIEQEIKNDSRNIVENLNNIDPNRGIDTSGVKGPYFNPDAEIPPDGTRPLRKNDLTPTNVKTSNMYNDRMAETGGEQVPGVSQLDEKVTNAKDLYRPYWPDQDLQDAIKQANKEAQVRENFGDEYPSDDLARGEPSQADLHRDQLAQQTPEEAKIAMYQASVLDAQNPRNPYIPQNKLEEAQRWADQGQPSHSQMEIPKEWGNIPYWADAALEKAKVSAARTAESRKGGPVDISRDGGGMMEDINSTPEKKAAIEKETGVDITPDPTITPDANEAMARFLSVARKKQGGHIDLTAMTGIGFRDLLDGLDKIKDIKWWGKLLPVTENQREKILGNPIISAVYNKLREYQNIGDARLNHYKTYLEGLDDFMVKQRKDALAMFKVLADIQDPELKEKRQFAQDTNTREAFLKEQGMDEASIPMAIKVLNVLQHLGKQDQNNAVAAFGHNWHLEPMYFPREHTGAYTVSIVDATGTPVYMRGFDDSALAHKYKTAFEQQLQSTDHKVALERNETSSLADVYTMLRMNEGKIPDFLKGINDKLLKELEVAKRKFEMERSSEKVAGYTGETTYGENASGAFRRSDDKLLTLLQRRMEQSYRLEVNAKILKELKEPLIDSGALENHPNLENYTHQLLARELGVSISKFHSAGKGIDFIVDNVGKHVDGFMGEMKGYAGGDVSYFKPQAVARLAQAYTGLMSMFKLAASPATIMANTSTWFMVPLEGFRVASKEGQGQHVAMAAAIKHYMSEHDRSFQEFMKDAKIEQMVDPNVSDPMIIARTKEATRIARAINAPRDFVELQTNKAALSYFYQYYKLTRPELEVTSREFKQLVYDATRSWTGDYTPTATPMFISQGGEAGRLMSNFAKWKFNQLGRLFDDIKDMKQGNAVPFMYTMLTTTLLAGAAGAPIIAEYEAIRRIGMKLGWWDMPPLSGALYQVKDKVEKEFGKGWGKVADAAIRSPVTVGMEEGFKAIGLESGPDMSSNLRFSSVLEANTLPFQFMTDFYHFTSANVKSILKPLGVGHGPTAQEVKDALKFLPTGAGNVAEELYKNYLASGSMTKGIKTPDGKTRYIDQFSSKDQGMYVQSPEEKGMAFAGVKSSKQNEYTDRLYYKEWSERYEKNEMTKLTNQFIENLRDPQQMQSIAKEMAQLKGQKGIDHLIQEVEKRSVERKTSYFEREVMKEMNNQDTLAQTKALKLLREMRPSK